MTREEALQAHEEIRKEKIRINGKFSRGLISKWERDIIREFQNALMRRLRQIAKQEEEKAKERCYAAFDYETGQTAAL